MSRTSRRVVPFNYLKLGAMTRKSNSRRRDVQRLYIMFYNLYIDFVKNSKTYIILQYHITIPYITVMTNCQGFWKVFGCQGAMEHRLVKKERYEFQ